MLSKSHLAKATAIGVAIALLSFSVYRFFITPTVGPQGLQVTQGQVRELIAGRDMTAGYFVLTNHGTESVTLTGVSSTLARSIEMHETTMRDGMMRMRPITTLTLKAGEQIKFEPGGLHLMIFGVPTITEPFPITLFFTDDQQVSAQLYTLNR